VKNKYCHISYSHNNINFTFLHNVMGEARRGRGEGRQARFARAKISILHESSSIYLQSYLSGVCITLPP